MPPIEFGQKVQGPASPVGAVRNNAPAQSTPVASTSAPAASSASAEAAVASVQTSQALDPGKPPVDESRVSVIRNAIQRGTYPLLPTKVADAMIAAGLMLSTKA